MALTREELDALLELVSAQITNDTSDCVEDSVRLSALKDDFIAKYGQANYVHGVSYG